MTAQHRKSLWIHSVFSLLMCLGLLVIVLTGRHLSTTVLASLITAYVLGNAYIHIKRNDYKRETLYEYALIGGVVFIVLGSALAR